MWKGKLVTVLLIGLLVVLGNHLLYRHLEGARLDLTADDLYSLTPGTLDILERMRTEGVQPVDLSLYFSATAGKTLPSFIRDFIGYQRYLRSLLKEYERAAQGRVRVHFIDPVPDSDEAQDALDFGLDGKRINQEGDLFFFGLVIQTRTGSREVIEFLWPEQQESVEYEISKRLHGLLWPSGRTIGVLSSLEVFGTADNPYLAQMLAAQGKSPQEKWLAIRVLEESHTVERIDPDTDRIDPKAFELVVVIHPKGLSDKTLWALDEWVVKGGNALVFLDPYAIDDEPPANPQQPFQAFQYRRSSELGRLLAAWGLEMPTDRFAADLDLAVRRAASRRGPAESVVVDLAVDETTRAQAFAAGHPIFQGVNDLRLLLPGTLGVTEEATAEVSAILTTTESGGTLTIEPGFGGGESLAYTDLGNPAALRDGLESRGAPVPIAYQITGRIASAFPEGAEFPMETPQRPPGLPPDVQLPPPPDAEMVQRDPVPEEERGESTLLVFADVDLISDEIAFQRNMLGLILAANDNHKLLLNAVDYLLGAQALMSIRAKHTIDRPFTLFDEIEAAAEKETLQRERQLRADIAAAEEQLREKQREISGENAALFQKKMQDEVAALNAKIRAGNRELREIRNERRQALAREESKVRFAVMGWMPALVLAVGIGLAVRRQRRHRQAMEDRA